MRKIRIINSKVQKKLVLGGYQALIDHIREPVIGSIVLSLVYGLLIITSSGPIKRVFETGLYEHVAKITIPLSIELFIFLLGITLCLRTKKYIKIFHFLRFTVGSIGILTIDLLSIFFGILIGITLPSLIANGFQIVVLNFINGSLFFTFTIFSVYWGIQLLYIKRKFNNKKYIPLIGILLCLVSMISSYLILNELILEVTCKTICT